MSNQTILERWSLTEQELTIIVDSNPSLRGMLLGYVAEFKLRSLLVSNPYVTSISKPDDHSRKQGDKNDTILTYKGHAFTFEVKSLQTNTIKYHPLDDRYTGKAQVDASDKRTITFPDGSTLTTTNLLRGDFDILAINLYQFRNEWDFAFALNRDLPSSTYNKYSQYHRDQLLATTVSVTWPVSPPFVLNPFELLDILIEEREG